MSKKQRDEVDDFEKSLHKKGLIPWIVVVSLLVVATGIITFVGILHTISKAFAGFLGHVAYMILK